MARPTSVLTALGFAPTVDRIYQQLRTHSGRELSLVAAALRRTPEELREEIGPLLDAGVVRIDKDELVVEPYIEALRLVLAAQARDADRARGQLESLSHAVGLLAHEVHASAATHDRIVPLAGEVVTASDIERLYATVRDVMLRSRGDVLMLRPDQWRSPTEPTMTSLLADALRPGGRTARAIYPVHAARDAPEALAARAAVGEQIRVLPDLPTRMLVIGDSHLVMPDPLGYGDMPLLVVRQPAIVQMASAWFMTLWERAATPEIGTRASRRDLRRFLLQQLAAGANDEQIARNLAISLRTVRRRVAELMGELGADTRFQAGVEAARRGWL